MIWVSTARAAPSVGCSLAHSALLLIHDETTDVKKGVLRKVQTSSTECFFVCLVFKTEAYILLLFALFSNFILLIIYI